MGPGHRNCSPLVVLLFPDGQLPSALLARRAVGLRRRLRAHARQPRRGDRSAPSPAHPSRWTANGGPPATDQPDRLVRGWSQNLLLLLVLLLSVAFIGRQALSWRRSSGERRQQLKWLASGAAGGVSAVLAVPTPRCAAGPVRLLSGLAWFGFAALPVSIGVAILKYRLYDIDRIISRTLAYALVTGLLVGVYAGLVLLATQVLGFASTGRWPRPRWPRRRCSPRCGAGCSASWTGGSTGPATTPTRSSPPSATG